MPLEIVLVRHGQSGGNRDGIFVGHGSGGLTPLGVRQAEATAQALAAAARINRLYTSDLPRSVATAEPLARLTGLPLVQEAALRERHIGAFAGMTFDQVQEQFPEGWAAMMARAPDYRPEGGESHRECAGRVGQFLDEVLARHAEGRVILFSHGVAINHMLRHLLGIASDGSRSFFRVDNCSLHRFQRFDDGMIRIHSINETLHLSGVEPDAPGE